jgi:site-specific recombinase XerD
MTPLPPLLQSFFTSRLTTEIGASPHTIASYRDTFKLLLRFVQERTGTRPDRLDLADLDAATIGAFLQHLETERHNSVSTRNTRLAAIHSLFRHAGTRAPEHAELIARVLATQTKRTSTTAIDFLDRAELEALLAAPDLSTWHGRRDHALLVLAAQTGLRVSELTGLTLDDLHLGTGPHVRCLGLRRIRRKPRYAGPGIMPRNGQKPWGWRESGAFSRHNPPVFVRDRQGRRAGCQVPGNARLASRWVRCAPTPAP